MSSVVILNEIFKVQENDVSFQIKHSIRGCIRNVTVNDDVNDYDFVRGVDRCYSDVEKGAHFTGNSYAILGMYYTTTSL